MLSRTWQKYCIENRRRSCSRDICHLLIILLANYFYFFSRISADVSTRWQHKSGWLHLVRIFYHYSIIFYSIIFLSLYCPSGESEDRWEALGKTINLDQPWATMEIIVRLSIPYRGHTRSIGSMYQITYFREKLCLMLLLTFTLMLELYF